MNVYDRTHRQSGSALPIYIRMLLLFAATVAPSIEANAGVRISSMPESSPTYHPSFIEGYSSLSALPYAPFALGSVHFRGWQQNGSQEQRNGAYLVYRYKIEFDEQVDLEEIVVRGAAFNGDTSVLRLLNSQRSELRTVHTTFGNFYSLNILDCRGVRGSTFYLDEFDTSQTWRFRDAILISYRSTSAFENVTAEPSSSATFPIGTNNGGFISKSDHVSAPSDFKSVQYRGTATGGNLLAYKLKIDYSTPVIFRYGLTRGAAFIGTFRASSLVGTTVSTMPTSSAPSNQYFGFLLDCRRYLGNSLRLEETDTNSIWRYRDAISFIVEPAIAVQISGTVLLADLASGVSVIGEPIELEVYSGQSRLESQQVFLDGAGKFYAQVHNTGPVDVFLKGRHWLRSKKAMQLVQGENNLATVALCNGDADGDNYIGSDDYLLLNMAFDTVFGDIRYNLNVDFNGDGYIGTDDYLILSRNFDKQGD